jgi:hypothetical protein
MYATVTIKMEAQSKEELVNTFAMQVGLARDHFEGLKKEGVFGKPENVELRYLVIGGGWREESAEPAGSAPENPDAE